MGDLTVDVSTMQAVSRQAKRAASEFGSERALSAADCGSFGSDAVAAAFSGSANAHDAMIRSLGADADTLSAFVAEAAATIVQADDDLARQTR